MPFILVNRQQTLGMLLGCELCSVPEPVECILFVTSTSSVTDIFLSQKRKGTQRKFSFPITPSLHYFILHFWDAAITYCLFLRCNWYVSTSLLTPNFQLSPQSLTALIYSFKHYFLQTIDLFSYTDKKYYLLHNRAILENPRQERNRNV